MSKAPSSAFTLHVEGEDDLHSILHLLIRHGIPFDAKPFPGNLPVIAVAGTVEKLLAKIPLLRFANGNVVGYVLDADVSFHARWNSVRDRMIGIGMTDAPSTAPESGFVGESKEFNTRVGVWLMPDNLREGKLEDFLRELVPADDPLIGHAEASTLEAKKLGAAFKDSDAIKAIMHAWLAWQKDPGKPFGTAIKATYFSHDTSAALSFVKWFRELYRIGE